MGPGTSIIGPGTSIIGPGVLSRPRSQCQPQYSHDDADHELHQGLAMIGGA